MGPEPVARQLNAPPARVILNCPASLAIVPLERKRA